MNELATVQTQDLTPEQLGGEIRLLTGQARRMALSYAIQIGYRLKLAHEKVGPHGWAEWLGKETEFSPAAASRFEKLYEGYGSAQGSLLGVENNFPTLEKISVSNALRLLAVPEEEREQVAEELDAEHLSTRELEKALKERDEAKKAAEKAEAERDRARKDAEKAEGETRRLERERDAAVKEAEGQKQTADALRKSVKELESRPVEVAVEKDPEALREIEALRKKLESAESGADAAILLARQAQEGFAGAMDRIEAMRETHPETAEKLLTGMEKIAQTLLERVKGARG